MRWSSSFWKKCFQAMQETTMSNITCFSYIIKTQLTITPVIARLIHSCINILRTITLVKVTS